MNGGAIVAEVLIRHGVRSLFTLCGGHIAPILVESEKRGIRVVDARHEASAVFAADAVSRLTGIPGVAAVTAGPGVTNSLTALTNARFAQSPLVLLGGAAAGILRGRGALQDMDQLALLRSVVKWSARATRVRDIAPLLSRAFVKAREGVPGPVFLELPIDLLYGEALVREWFARGAGKNPFVQWYLRRQFAGGGTLPETPMTQPRPHPAAVELPQLAKAARPVIVAGSQVAGDPSLVPQVAAALERIGIPVFLSGMARGLLGAGHPLHVRHRRKNALREADFVLLAGVPADFRLNYGRDIARDAFVVSVNRSARDVRKNRKPDVAIHGDPGAFLVSLASAVERRPLRPPEDRGGSARANWLTTLRDADAAREKEIDATAAEATELVNPVALCRAVDRALARRSIVVADGGDFVSTASYIVRPRAPLSWLDPGVFGTLGVGAGFALGAATARPHDELWILYGDGALGFTLAELDTFARHRIPVIAVVANDGCWSQIHREQVEILGAPTGCMLARTDYHVAAEGLGARGLLLRDPLDTERILAEAKEIAGSGVPVLINAWIGRTEFRKGSISM